ncbi:MAG: NAD(P)-dependent glycerol-3-phosphate dehydrogenase [Spirochaetes bacterium]|nr:NAD(P)-dependent glycerol-3-phosphate dehydrogenase [Spirochaetota bacterium]
MKSSGRGTFLKNFFEKNESIGILGAGSWGTTLAWLLSKRHKVRVWEFDRKQLVKVIKERENKKFLPHIKLSKKIIFSNDAPDVITRSNIVIIALPSHTIRETVKKYSDLLKKKIMVNVSKGIENKTLKRISEILYDETGNKQIYVLSGPSHAEEVARKIPTTVVLSSLNQDKKRMKYLQGIFITEHFRVYTNPDIIGVELCGSLKNIIAIAAGISDGIGFGSNTKAAIMTRGITEIRRLGMKLGAHTETFGGLAGIGDLITTCISKYSRNRHVGEELGKGKNISSILKKMVMIAEGVKTTLSAYNLSKKHRVSMPITEEVYNIIYRNKNTKKAVQALMSREPKPEIW